MAIYIYIFFLKKHEDISFLSMTENDNINDILESLRSCRFPVDENSILYQYKKKINELNENLVEEKRLNLQLTQQIHTAEVKLDEAKEEIKLLRQALLYYNSDFASCQK